VKRYVFIGIMIICLVMNIAGCTGTTATVSTKTITTTATTTNTSTTGTTKTINTTAFSTTSTSETTSVPATTDTRITTSIGTTAKFRIEVVKNEEELFEAELLQIPIEIHTIEITVLEVMRGNKSWDMVKAADAANKAPDAGYEYLLARIKFVYSSGGSYTYALKQQYFKAYSSENKEYAAPSIILPEPVFIGTVLQPGQTAEGWVPFIVDQNESKPVMLYSPQYTWFQLYQ
jgi:hypothetical protein